MANFIRHFDNVLENLEVTGKKVRHFDNDPYHISLSPGRRQTVSPGEGDPKRGKVDTWVHFKTSKGGQVSSKRHNSIDEIFRQHFYLLKYQKLFS